MILAAALASAAFAGAMPSKAPAFTRSVVERVVAVVNDETVLLSEWEEEWETLRRTLPPEESAEPDKVADYRQKVLESLIRDRLISQEADKQKVVVKDDQIEFRIKEIRDRTFAGDETKLVAALRLEGMTLDEYRERLRKQIRQETLVFREVNSKVAIGEAEVEAYWRDHPAEFADVEERRIRHVLVPLSSKTRGAEARAAEASAKKLLSQLKDGADFAALAKKHSGDAATRDRGGELGWVKRGELVSALEDAVFASALAKGGLAPVVRGPLGFEVIEVLEVKGTRPRGLDEVVSTPEGDVKVREVVKGKLQNDRFRDALEAWVKKLRSEATIVLKD